MIDIGSARWLDDDTLVIPFRGFGDGECYYDFAGEINGIYVHGRGTFSLAGFIERFGADDAPPEWLTEEQLSEAIAAADDNADADRADAPWDERE